MISQFIGVVEDVNDPGQMNRVRVRIYSKHTEDKTLLPTEQLPWSQVVMPVTSASVPSVGNSLGLLPGSWVFGTFLDTDNEQEALILGSLPSESTRRTITDPTQGFSDPSNKHPVRSDIDTPLAARTNDYKQSQAYENKATQRITGIGVASQPHLSTLTDLDSPSREFYDLPDPATTTQPSYPSNIVHQYESGHTLEYDNTAGYERIAETHSSGTYREITHDGTTTQVIQKDSYRVILGEDSVYIVGNCKMTVNGDLSTHVKGDYVLEVDGDMHENIHGSRLTKVDKSAFCEVVGNSATNIGGNSVLNIVGTRREETAGASNLIFQSTLDTTVSGDHTEISLARRLITSTQNMKINCGEKIHVNTKVTRFSGDAIAGSDGVSLITHLHRQRNGNDRGGGIDTAKPISGTGVGS